MNRIVSSSLGGSLALVATLVFAGCTDDAPFSPDAGTAQVGAASGLTASADATREPNLGTCQNLKPEDGSKLAFQVYATGVQIYRWNGSGWAFVRRMLFFTIPRATWSARTTPARTGRATVAAE